MIEISNEQIERVNAVMHGIANGSGRVFSNAINRALATVQSKSGDTIREVYNIKKRDITGRQILKRANSSDLVGGIEFAGTVIPLIKFKVSPSQPKRKTVSASVLKAEGGKRLAEAYVADLGVYGVGVFERMTQKRESSTQLFGPSLAHMAENANVLEKMEAVAQEKINERIDHEMTRILNGYGG